MRKKLSEMFKNPQQISNTLAKFSNLKDKRNEVIKACGPLWYVFGYELEHKPWLTYKEKHCNELVVSYHKNGQITEMVIKNDIL